MEGELGGFHKHEGPLHATFGHQERGRRLDRDAYAAGAPRLDRRWDAQHRGALHPGRKIRGMARRRRGRRECRIPHAEGKPHAGDFHRGQGPARKRGRHGEQGGNRPVRRTRIPVHHAVRGQHQVFMCRQRLRNASRGARGRRKLSHRGKLGKCGLLFPRGESRIERAEFRCGSAARREKSPEGGYPQGVFEKDREAVRADRA